MFSISVKSVPGCFVLIAPSVIGLPLAATPGFGPHDDVAEAAADAVGAAWLLELIAKPTIRHAPMAAKRPTPQRTRRAY